jgi:peptidoglycan hydrolase-like protein with peptidoglycan-binding domain
MFMPLKLKSVLAENANANPDDVLAIKTLLEKLGLYEIPEWGLTDFPDRELFEAIRAFQDRAGLKVDGRMKPGGETQTALHKIARMLQGLRPRRKCL